MNRFVSLSLLVLLALSCVGVVKSARATDGVSMSTNTPLLILPDTSVELEWWTTFTDPKYVYHAWVLYERETGGSWDYHSQDGSFMETEPPAYNLRLFGVEYAVGDWDYQVLTRGFENVGGQPQHVWNMSSNIVSIAVRD